MSFFRPEYVGVLLFAVLIGSLVPIAISSARLWATIIKKARSPGSPRERPINDPATRKEVKKSLFWLLVCFAAALTIAALNNH